MIVTLLGTGASVPSRILVVDDDPNILEIVRAALSSEGFIVATTSDSRSALQLVEAQHPALVILDVVMESRDAGYRLCRAIRADYDIPIIFLTARDTDIDAVVGLELGADDYVTKPFSHRELTARVRTVLRRAKVAASSVSAVEPDTERRWSIGEFSVDEVRQTVATRKGERTLSRIEFLILRSLAADAGKVLSRAAITREVYGAPEAASPRTIDSHIRRLRAKMNEIGEGPIETVRGVGYKLSVRR